MSVMSAKRIKLDEEHQVSASGGDDGPTLADVWRPNLHKLYELAVQDGSEIDVMTKCFAELRGRWLTAPRHSPPRTAPHHAIRSTRQEIFHHL